jgi:hypothetical protein
LCVRRVKTPRKYSDLPHLVSTNLIRWGVFRLTDPPGMQSVLKCQQTGLFHPHAELNIYTDALRPGHVFEAKGLEFEVVDLRPEL